MSEADVDPRRRTLHPTPEEIEQWAGRERRRRAAWAAGPGDHEKHEWARRYRWRAALGFEESGLGPAPEEIDLWAEREHERRAAWLAGPTEAETEAWAAQQRRRSGVTGTERTAGPTADEIAEWVSREKHRRAEWRNGPSDEEKHDWALRKTGRVPAELFDLPSLLASELPETASTLLREAQLAGEGVLYALTRAPGALWSYFVRSGRAFEEEFYAKPRRSRVRY